MHRLVIDVDGVRRSGCRGRLVDDRCRCVGSEARGAPEKGDRVLPWIILRFVAPYGDLIASSGTPRSSSYSFVCPSCCMPSLSCSLLVDLCDMAAGSAIRSYRKQSRPFLAFVSGAAAHRWLQKLVGLGECEDEGDSGASASLLGYLAGLLCALVSGVCLPCSETGIFGDQHDYVPLSWCEAEGSWSRSCLLAPASDISGDHIEVLECVLACEPLVTLGPDRSWSGRLNAHSNAGARLVRTYALLSTLGGGHFMCRQVMHSLLLARMQGAVARAMGDETLAGKCRINEGYGLIWLGQYRAARHLIGLLAWRFLAVHSDFYLLLTLSYFFLTQRRRRASPEKKETQSFSDTPKLLSYTVDGAECSTDASAWHWHPLGTMMAVAPQTASARPWFMTSSTAFVKFAQCHKPHGERRRG
jgi:hypothetical protein